MAVLAEHFRERPGSPRAVDAESTRPLGVARRLRSELGRREGDTKHALDLARERLGDEAFERA